MNQGEVGSSTMPHKVTRSTSRIRGNLGLANALLRHLATSFRSRAGNANLSDSTVLRIWACVLAIRCLGVSCRAVLPGWKSIRRDLPPISTPTGKCWRADPYRHARFGAPIPMNN